MKYASLFQRILAQIIDYVVFCIVFFPVTYLVKGTWLMTPEDHRWIIFDPICGVFLVIIFAYFIVLEWLTGYTAGKYLLRIKVVGVEGGKISLKQSLIRNFGRMIDGLPCFNIIGIVSIVKSPVKQRMGDKWAKTFVVEKGDSSPRDGVPRDGVPRDGVPGSYTKLFLIFLLIAPSTLISSSQSIQTINNQILKDKIAGGWAGKMIGVTYGAPTEFRFQQAINTDSIKWTPADIKGSIWQDDIYVQLTFLMAMDKFGVDAPSVKFQEMLAKAGYPLWCANMQARKNYFDGIYPPPSGNPVNSFRADDIDFQIEADYIGFMNPGMTQNVVDIAGKIGHIMNYGDGVYGGVFLGAMYSEAFFEKDIRKIIEKGLEAIPPGSDYARIIRDVITLHDHYPADWQAAWKELDTKWGDVDISGAGSAFNIDAKLNGAYIVMGLLYGDGDIYKTLEVTTRCGQDSDCNPSSAMAVLGVIRGFSDLPVEMQNGVNAVGDSLFINTTYSFNNAVEKTYEYAIQNILKNNGNLKDNMLYIPEQQLNIPELEVSFPGVVYDTSISVFSPKEYKFAGDWQVYKEKSWGDKDQAMFSGKTADELTLTFEGTGISLFGNWVRDGGKADIYLDGKLSRSIDTYYHYADQEHLNVSIWHVFGLQPGKHTVNLVVKGEKNSLSSGTNVYVCQAVIYKTSQKNSESYKFSFKK